MRGAGVALVVAMVASVAGCGPTATPTPPPANGVPAPSFPDPAVVTYCTDGGVALSLDVFEPPAPPPVAGAPLLVVVHGGSWTFGNDRISSQGALTQQSVAMVLARGVAVASINYRLAPRFPWPAQIIDTRCALRYLRETAGRWHIDPHRVIALGNSAGAQLVSLLALSAGAMPQWDNGQHASQSSAVQAVVDLWGPEDLTASGWSAAAMSIGRVVFGSDWGGQNAELREASPISYVRPGAPPFLVIQGAADQLVPPAQSRELLDRLVAAGDAATLVLVAGAAHELGSAAGVVISPSIEQLAAQVTGFVMGVP